MHLALAILLLCCVIHLYVLIAIQHYMNITIVCLFHFNAKNTMKGVLTSAFVQGNFSCNVHWKDHY